MNIAVVGANGKSGRAFVEEALHYGHSIRAGVFRATSTHNSNHDNLQFVSCDATNLADVQKLIKGCDAVVSLIGHINGSPAFVQTTATSNILSAMDKYGVKRLISLTGTGVRIAGDTPSLIDRVLNIGISIIDPARIRDGQAHADVIRNSDVDWTILRVLKLTDFGHHTYSLSEHGPARVVVSRKTVASIVLALLVDGTYIKLMPVVSSK